MRNPFATLLACAVGLVACAFATISPIAAQSTAFDASKPPSESYCYGTIRNEADAPVAGAKIYLIQGVTTNFDPIFSAITSKPVVIETTSEEDGSFSINLRTHPEFWRASPNNLLLINAPGCEAKTAKIPNHRLLVDAPIEISMQAGEASTIQIFDHRGNALSDLKVSAAAVRSEPIAWQFASKTVTTTDPEGRAQIQGFNANNLSLVYVTSPKHGNHRLQVIEKEGRLVARIPKTFSATVQSKSNAPLDQFLEEGPEVLLVCLKRNNFAPGQVPALTWAKEVIEPGPFQITSMTSGSIWTSIESSESFPFVLSQESRSSTEFDPEKSQVIEFELEAARSAELKFVNEESQPIANLDVDSTLRVRRRTDSNGIYQHWLPKDATLDGQLFPFDAFEQFTMDAFGVRLVSMKESEDGEIPPIVMSYSDAVRGVALTQSRQPVANAQITCTFGQERFTINKQATTNLKGEFLIRGLPKNSSVSLSAQKEQLVASSTEPIDSGASDKRIELLLEEADTAILSGMVLNQAGTPIADAKVTIYRADVQEKEGFSNESVFPSVLENGEAGFRTDEQGRFRTPPVADFQKRFQVVVEHPEFRSFRSYFRPPIEVSSERANLGEFRLLASAKRSAIQIHVTWNGEPISGAKIAILDLFNGNQSASTDLEGNAQVLLDHSPKTFAVKAADLPVLLACRTPESGKLTLELDSAPDDAAFSLHSRHDSYQATARQLTNELEYPKHGESTFYRQLRYFQALATADTNRLLEILADPNEKFEYKSEFALMALDPILRNAPEVVLENLDRFASLPDRQVNLLAAFSLTTQDDAVQEEQLGEAIVGLSGLSGEQKYLAAGWLADFLAFTGHLEESRELIQTCWDEADELREMLEKDERIHKRAVARVFAPKLAFLDIEESLRFIELSSDQRESESLKSQALVILSLLDMDRAISLAESEGITLSLGLNSFLDRAGTQVFKLEKLRSWLESLGPKLPNSGARFRALLLTASFTEDLAVRRPLFADAADCLRETKVDFWYHWSDPAKYALELLPAMDNIRREELAELIHATFEASPADFSSQNHLMVFANRIRLLALYSPEMAMKMLKPAFEDTVWMHQNTRPGLDGNQLVGATAWIDPSWASQNVRDLADRFPDDGVTKLQLYSSVISNIEQILNLTKQTD